MYVNNDPGCNIIIALLYDIDICDAHASQFLYNVMYG